MLRLPAITMVFVCAVPAFAGMANSLLDLTPDGRLLAVANTDSGTVSLVDVRDRKKLVEIPVGDHPEGVTWVSNGTKLLVTVYGDNVVKVIDPVERKVIATIRVAGEPYGIVASPNGRSAYVSHDYPGLVSEIDLRTMTVRRTIPTGPACRGIALSPDEKRVYATEFFTGRLHAIDLAAGNVIDSWHGIETDNLARNVVVHPTLPKAYLAHLRSRTSVFSARGSIEPELSIVDIGETNTSAKRRTGIALDTFNGVYVMANPWESAISPDGEILYVVYAGSNDASAIRLLPEYPYVRRTTLPVQVGKHPRAVRVSPEGSEVYIYNTLDYAVGVYSPDLRTRKATIAVCEPTKTAEWRRGKELFVSAVQPMGGTKWISCSTCHPDGLSDGRVWQNPEGPRRTPHLFGLAHTHPLHWSADRDEVQDFEYTIRGKLMQGRGLYSGSMKGNELAQVMTGKSKDLDAMALYANSFESKLSPHIPAPGKLSAEAERGKAIFFSAESKCATCHSGPYYTDSSRAKPFKLHDVGTGGGEGEKLGPAFDTPTLIAVYRMGPYLHDGRAKTLEDVITKNPGDKHGKTSHLKPSDVSDLVAFLKSLPYELQAGETPNTVR
jgi:YVTN family beta-propeller protein